eukprot:Sspe_Gene.90292::Locus_61880_Transcript_1_1_Confidence_1.000_Length_1390::g.90292::m.90292
MGRRRSITDGAGSRGFDTTLKRLSEELSAARRDLAAAGAEIHRIEAGLDQAEGQTPEVLLMQVRNPDGTTTTTHYSPDPHRSGPGSFTSSMHTVPDSPWGSRPAFDLGRMINRSRSNLGMAAGRVPPPEVLDLVVLSRSPTLSPTSPLPDPPPVPSKKSQEAPPPPPRSPEAPSLPIREGHADRLALRELKKTNPEAAKARKYALDNPDVVEQAETIHMRMVGGGLGLTLGSDMALLGVRETAEGQPCEVSRFIGWRLSHVQGKGVSTPEDVAEACEGADEMVTLRFEVFDQELRLRKRIPKGPVPVKVKLVKFYLQEEQEPGLFFGPEMVLEGADGAALDEELQEEYLPDYEGWRLTHVDSRPVATPEDFDAACAGKEFVRLRFEREKEGKV